MTNPAYLQYPIDVVDGKIPACEILVNSCGRFLDEYERPPGEWIFIPEFGDDVIDFIHTVPSFEEEMGGLPITLQDWQILLIHNGYSWRSEDNPTFIKRFIDIVVECTKKNGKSTIAGLLALYELIYGPDAGQIYSVATKKEQAEVVWNICKNFIDVSPEWLVGECRPRDKVIYHGKTIFKPLPKENHKTTVDGLNPTFLIFDEAAAITTDDHIQKLVKSQKTRMNKTRLWITHPYPSTESLYYRKRETLRKLLSGQMKSTILDRTMFACWQLDSEKEMKNKKNWRKAIPNLGYNIPISDVAGEVEEVNVNPRERDKTLIYTFGIWTNVGNSWLNPSLWDNCTFKKGEKINRTVRLLVGIDFAERFALTAVCSMFIHDRRRWDIEFQFFTNEEYFKYELSEELRDLYKQARDDGILTIVPGPTIDTSYCVDYVLGLSEKYKLDKVAYDPARATFAVSDFIEAGLPTFPVKQGVNLVDALDNVESRIMTSDIKHAGHPFLRWQFQNVVITEGKNKNKYINKDDNQPHNHIDGFSALLTAARAVLEPEEKRKRFTIRGI